MIRAYYVALIGSKKVAADRMRTNSLIFSSCLFTLMLLTVLITFSYGLTPQTKDLFYSIKTEEMSGFSVEWNENMLDSNDFEPNFVVDGKLFFRAHQTENQASTGSGKKQIHSLDADGKIQVYAGDGAELEKIEMMYSSGNKLFFSAKEGLLFTVDISSKTTSPSQYSLLSYSRQQVNGYYVNFLKSNNTLLVYAATATQSIAPPPTSQTIEMVYFPLTVPNGGDALSPSLSSQNELTVIVNNGTNNAFFQLSIDPPTTITLNEVGKLAETDESMPFSWSECVLFHYKNQIIAYNRSNKKYKIIIDSIPNIQFHSFQNDVYIVGSRGGKLHVIKKDGTVRTMEQLTQVTDFFAVENGFYAVDAESRVFNVKLVDNDVKVTEVKLTSQCDDLDFLTLNNENLILTCRHKMTKLNSVIRFFKDEEYPLVEDDGTSDKGGWTFFMIPLSKANIEFTLLATANQVNPKIIRFTLKPPITCHGKNFTDPTVCNGKGKCVANDACSCFGNFDGSECEKCKRQYEGPNCEFFIIRKCFGVPYNDSSVCSGRGECVSENTCKCRHEYSGDKCLLTTCFGVSSNFSGVCSGHGYCSDYNVCECEHTYTGPMCEISDSPVPQAKLYPIMITFGALSLVTVILLLAMVFWFLGKHRKEYLATYGKRTVVASEDEDNLFLDEIEDDQPEATQRENSNKKSQNEYSLSLSDEELEVYN
ncbi:hypothetical protein FDP41_001097 [Naegleria fowleri]|uniref:EGF-like domain-containing protein n=1 Tax=Naegleria fowleri TaxID=5763 RepID=A0A6A5C041_NAEFO|nr:uncharacterized protein FDP41_001097 [Naegleria fowleri]KAF0979944.1 hypothetical protein FDP41_001097 [Naegleria fowleri]